MPAKAYRPTTQSRRAGSSSVYRLIPRELLSSRSPIPAYHRLAQELRRLIDRGALEAGEQLPSEELIAEHVYTSRPTVRQALTELQRHHLIRREHGRGTFVNPR